MAWANFLLLNCNPQNAFHCRETECVQWMNSSALIWINFELILHYFHEWLLHYESGRLPCFFSQLTAQPSTSCTSLPISVTSPISPMRFTSGKCSSDTWWPSICLWGERWDIRMGAKDVTETRRRRSEERNTHTNANKKGNLDLKKKILSRRGNIPTCS